MQNKILLLIITILLLPIMLVTVGCSAGRDNQEIAINPDIAELYQNQAVAKRFQQPGIDNSTIVDSAVELSMKYTQLVEESTLVSRQNQDLIAKNKQLQEQISSLENQLQQAQKELSEANQMLISMRSELNNWKTEVLGFRSEMRNAETAQLEALLKILKVLGGETVNGPVTENTSAVVSLNTN